MEEGGSEGAEKIKEEITCALCLDILEQPRILPCHHVYCNDCLGSIARKSGGGTIPCPECRHVVQLPGNNVANLPTAFHINRLKEIYFSMEKKVVKQATSYPEHSVNETDNGDQPERDKVIQLCPKHTSQSLDVYCKTCEKLICRDCVVFDQSHSGHKYDRVEDAARAYRKALVDSLGPLQRLKPGISQAIVKVAAVREEIASQEERSVEAVTMRFDELAAVLQEQKAIVLSELKKNTEGKAKVITAQEENLRVAHTQLETTLASARNAADNMSDSDFLSSREFKVIPEAIGSLGKRLQSIPLDPCETSQVVFHSPSVNELRALFSNKGPTSRIECKASGKGLEYATTYMPTKFEIHMVYQDDNPCATNENISAHLTSIRNGSVTIVRIQRNSSSSYEASYVLQDRGRYDLHVQLNHVHISGSPFRVMVHPNFGSPVHNIRVQKPYGLAFNPSGNLLVSNCKDNKVKVFDRNHQNVQTLELPGVKQAGEIITDQDGNIYVSDTGYRQLHMFTKDGTKVMTAKAELQFPNGMAFSRNNKLFVCDSAKNRIQVFDSALKLIETFGTGGTKKGQFHFPNNIHIDSTGKMYVTDTNNCRIQVLNDSREHIHSLELNGWPNCMCVKGERMYVTDEKQHCVTVLHLSGAVLATFGEEHLKLPEGIAIDEDGFVYVADNLNNCVLVF